MAALAWSLTVGGTYRWYAELGHDPVGGGHRVDELLEQVGRRCQALSSRQRMVPSTIPLSGIALAPSRR